MIPSWLQWGRNFIVAEIDLGKQAPNTETAASMGPQLYRCGNLVGMFLGMQVYVSLQWGRNFIVAEIVPIEDKNGKKTTTLQWGRNFIVAEIAVPKKRQARPELLQWGRNFIVAEIRKTCSGNCSGP